MNFNDDGLLADANWPANHVIYFMFQWLSFASLQQAQSLTSVSLILSEMPMVLVA